MKIEISKMERSEHQGDWHDKPLRWLVAGPESETQKFSTKKDAEKYLRLRRRSSDQGAAIRNYCL
jgi:hypothetical protein